MEITSPAFEIDGIIPKRYTCDGDNVSPPLDFFEIPTGTQDLVLIVEDVDAPLGAFVHWVIWNINPSFDGIGEGNVTAGSVEGVNSAGQRHYSGPCPPGGETHRYFFRLYALSDKLDLPGSFKIDKVRDEMGGKVIDQAEIMAFYGR